MLYKSGRLIISGVISSLFMSVTANAAINLDRTRIIYDAENKSISTVLNNESQKLPYLAQSWIEDAQGNKDSSKLVALPPLQRIEPGEKSQLRIAKTEATTQLPQDRETLFWFNVREVPPKSSAKNVMQVAIQSRVKLFFRPTSLHNYDTVRWQEKLTVTKSSNHISIRNPTGYYVTLISLEKEDGRVVKAVNGQMIAPFSTEAINTGMQIGNRFTLSYINDYGGVVPMIYQCRSDECQFDSNKAGKK